jgi:alkyldihydroxyacetonephosphate synthase
MQSQQSPPAGIERQLRAIFPDARIADGTMSQLAYSRDQWPMTLLTVRDNRPVVSPPNFVVWPESAAEVAALVKVAAKLGIPLIPWGAGSGVCGGALATHGGIAVDMKRMSAVLDVCSADHLATFEAGILGQLLEDQLNMRGFTMGHFPSSIYCSTLGGWIAARSAGQYSSKYGKIEDMTEEMEVVTGRGDILTLNAHQLPELQQMIIGSEGTLGIITKATMRVHPLPQHRLFRAFQFPNASQGTEAMRRVMQRGLRPAVIRLYDEIDTLLARSSGQGTGGSSMLSQLGKRLAKLIGASVGDLQQRAINKALHHPGLLGKFADNIIPSLSNGCMAIVGFEGEQSLIEAELALCCAEMAACGGEDRGEAPGQRWFAHRHNISYKQSPIFASGGFVDTMEVATTWAQLNPLYHAVRDALSPSAWIMAHFSHAYSEGCSIYFTFAAAAEGRSASETLYKELWRQGLSAAIRTGATISHHHGVGLSKAAFMAKEHGESMSIYRLLKQQLDPAGILNPGKMGL